MCTIPFRGGAELNNYPSMLGDELIVKLGGEHDGFFSPKDPTEIVEGCLPLILAKAASGRCKPHVPSLALSPPSLAPRCRLPTHLSTP